MTHNYNKNSYPTLPLDSEKVLHYRGQCQKPREQEEIWSWFVLRRLSIYVTLALNHTFVTPNAISWLSVVFFLLSGWFLALAEPWACLFAVISYNVGYMCDCIDGELARLKNMTSRRGFFIDTLIRACSIPIMAAIALALFDWRQATSTVEVTAIYVTVVLSTFALLVPLAFHVTYSKVAQHDPVGDMRLKSRRHEWLAFFLGLPGFFAILTLVAVTEMVAGIVLLPVFFILYLSLFALKTVTRLYITYKHIK